MIGLDHVLGADAQIDDHAFVAGAGRDSDIGGQAAVQRHLRHLARAGHAAGQQVHRRAADELGDEFVDGPLVQFQRRADLRDAASGQNHDPVGQGHRLGLVMGDVDHRAVGHRGFQLRDLDPRGHPQRRVKVRERFVEQIDLGVAHDGPADGDPLALPARQRLGQAVQIGRQLQHLARALGRLADLVPGLARDLEGKGHVVAHRHVRIERVGLEHHRDAALAGRDVVHHLPVDFQRAAGDLFQPRDHPQQGGFAAARRTDENDEFARADIKVDIAQHLHVAIGLGNVGQLQVCHGFPPYPSMI